MRLVRRLVERSRNQPVDPKFRQFVDPSAERSRNPIDWQQGTIGVIIFLEMKIRNPAR
jgi:hypothetical protein